MDGPVYPCVPNFQLRRCLLFLLFARGLHSAYEKNVESADHHHHDDQVIFRQPQQQQQMLKEEDKFYYWEPHPQTGVFGPAAAASGGAAAASSGKASTIDGGDGAVVVEEKAWFRPTSLEDSEKPQKPEGTIQNEAMSELLNQFEYILDSDPIINEVGFIHPSQFATLAKDPEAGSSRSEASDALDGGDGTFWIRDHKLGISSEVVLRLYKAAREQFMNAIAEYKKLGDLSLPSAEALGIVVMKCSKSLVLLSPDFGTAWNSRKLIVSKKTQASMFTDELRLSALVLSYSPKSEQAWSHRRWVIKNMARNRTTLQEILREESDLVEKIAERSKMNYRAWNHRCWLVSYMDREQVIQELKQSKTWSGLHVADHSCFHYRMRLIIRVLEDCCRKQEEGSCDSCVQVYLIWQEELDWNEELIKRYLGREALWLYRRFLSLLWIRHFTTDVNDVSSPQKSQSSIQVNVSVFLDKELLLVNSCSEGSDDEFEDFEEQAICSASYMLWLTKQIPETQKLELREKIENERLDAMLKLVSLRGPPFGAI